MNLRGVKQFLDFRYHDFIKDKVTELTAIKYDDKEKMLKGTLTIVKDPEQINKYKTINFKMAGEPTDVQKYVLEENYHVVDIEKVTVWGEYMDGITVTCKGLEKNNAQNNEKKTA
ncbi:MAG: hypothetical protein IJ225_11175 [Solobacterium sp.]|nr:hypothetical protein [Solobacterium sp.]